jgi:uncharacterized protein YigE (DUF2233 family)
MRFLLWTVKRRTLLLLAALMAPAAAADAACRPLEVNGARYTVCAFDARQSRIGLFNLNAQGEPLGSFAALAGSLAATGQKLLFAMNGGMFGQDLKPVGLYVQDGKQARRLNRRNGPGNFHLKPNGVFYGAGDTVGVADSDSYAALGATPDFATQSGPMLVINGKIHPAFSASGTSRKIRNGVGVTDAHTAIFVISETAVNFHEFAVLFRDTLACSNALFLDGTISSLYAPELNRNDSFMALGPMVGVTGKAP